MVMWCPLTHFKWEVLDIGSLARLDGTPIIRSSPCWSENLVSLWEWSKWASSSPHFCGLVFGNCTEADDLKPTHFSVQCWIRKVQVKLLQHRWITLLVIIIIKWCLIHHFLIYNCRILEIGTWKMLWNMLQLWWIVWKSREGEKIK